MNLLDSIQICNSFKKNRHRNSGVDFITHSAARMLENTRSRSLPRDTHPRHLFAFGLAIYRARSRARSVRVADSGSCSFDTGRLSGRPDSSNDRYSWLYCVYIIYSKCIRAGPLPRYALGVEIHIIYRTREQISQSNRSIEEDRRNIVKKINQIIIKIKKKNEFADQANLSVVE